MSNKRNMAKVAKSMHVDFVKKKKDGKTYTYALVRQSYRVGKKVRKRTLANISNLPAHLIELIRRSLKGEAFLPASEAVRVAKSVAHGAALAVVRTMERLEMAKLLGRRVQPWHRLVLGMVAARVINPGSKRFTAAYWWGTSLPRLLGFGEERVTVNDLYEAMDELLRRKPAIEAKLARRHLGEGELVLYDVSSSYFEGRCCPLAAFGYNRDGKRGKKQFVYGLLTSREGCPVAVEVFRGNTADAATISVHIEKLRERFGFRRVVLVGDRGMITRTRIEEIERAGYGWITALRAPEIKRLGVEGLQLSLFDETGIAEVVDPERAGERLVVCRNPLVAEERRRKREEMLSATEALLSKVSQRVAKGRLVEPEAIALEVGKVVDRFKMGKHMELEIGRGTFSFRRREESIRQEAALDGVYVVRTNVPREEMGPAELVEGYKALRNVERAFRSMKTMHLELRPVFHRLEDRVRAHVFLCLLAYYVQWHMERALRPIRETEPTLYGSLRLVLERLNEVRLETLEVGGASVLQSTIPDEAQQKILDCLGITNLA